VGTGITPRLRLRACEPGKTREEKETGDDIPSFPYLLVFSISNNNNSKIAAITTLFLSSDKAVICSIEFPGGTLELSQNVTRKYSVSGTCAALLCQLGAQIDKHLGPNGPVIMLRHVAVNQ
jgi:hypothetical protein